MKPAGMEGVLPAAGFVRYASSALRSSSVTVADAKARICPFPLRTSVFIASGPSCFVTSTNEGMTGGWPAKLAP